MSKKPNKQNTDIPREYIMAANAVSAEAYVGHAAGLALDRSLDDEAEIQVIVMAKDVDTLKRFCIAIGNPMNDESNTYPVGMALQRDLRILPKSKAPMWQQNQAHHKAAAAQDDDL